MECLSGEKTLDSTYDFEWYAASHNFNNKMHYHCDICCIAEAKTVNDV